MAEEPEPIFEDALTRVERIVEDLERGEPSLSAALAKYEDGVKLLRRCYDLLDQAERSVALLTGVDEQGQPTTAPFDAAATPAHEAQAVAPAPAAGDTRTRVANGNRRPGPRPPPATGPSAPTLRSEPGTPARPSGFCPAKCLAAACLTSVSPPSGWPQTLHSTPESGGPVPTAGTFLSKAPSHTLSCKGNGGLVWTIAGGMPTITSPSWSYGEEDLLRRSFPCG